MLDDVLITLTGIFALVPGAGYLVDEVEGFTEGWTAFAQGTYILKTSIEVLQQILSYKS